MNAQAADTAVLVSAIITLVAIASKLITANLIQRSKRSYTKLGVRRREVIGRLKEVQLKTTSAKGTLEFWERRRTETAQRVLDAQRDLAAYEQQGTSPEAQGETGDVDGSEVEAGAEGHAGTSVAAAVPREDPPTEAEPANSAPPTQTSAPAASDEGEAPANPPPQAEERGSQDEGTASDRAPA